MTRSRSSIVSGSPATRDRPGSPDVIASDVRFLDEARPR